MKQKDICGYEVMVWCRSAKGARIRGVGKNARLMCLISVCLFAVSQGKHLKSEQAEGSFSVTCAYVGVWTKELSEFKTSKRINFNSRLPPVSILLI